MSVDAWLSRRLIEKHPDDAARTLEAMPARDAAGAISAVPEQLAAGVVTRMEMARAVDCLAQCGEDRAAAILTAAPVRLAMPIVRRMGSPERERLLQRIGGRHADRLRRSMNYPDDTAGALMDTEVEAFAEDVLTGDAVRRARQKTLRMLYYVFVTDRDQRLVGVLTLRELMQAPRARELREVATRPVVRLHVSDPRPVILANPAWTTFHALPVVDSDEVLSGVLRYDTLRALQAEATPGERPGLLPLGAAIGEAWAHAAVLFLDGMGAAMSSLRKPDSQVRG